MEVKLCECGCGQPAPIATKTDTSTNRIEGQPMHFRRGHNNLKPLTMERFLSYIEKRGECWVWVGTRASYGYGHLSVNGKWQRAHRIAFEMFIGEIPDGMLVCHNCPGGDNPACVNPAHLWLGTHHDNTQDMMRKHRNRHPTWKGSNHPQARLTETDIPIIRQLHADGLSYSVIGARYSLTGSAIFRIVHRKTWCHVL